MDIHFRDKVVGLWDKHFGGAELPICVWYTDDDGGKAPAPTKGHTCLIADLARVRKGQTLRVGKDSIGCPGGQRYLGFVSELRPGLEFFLSCGIPGKMEGERYKKSPEVVRETLANLPFFPAPARYAVFKRWDKLEAPDQPEIVFVLATPDVLAGLFTLANFDETDPNAVITPFGAGCGTLVQQPYLERASKRPRSVIGLFDPSARAFIPGPLLSFAAPMSKFARMADNMEESFLITGSWAKLRRRLAAGAKEK